MAVLDQVQNGRAHTAAIIDLHQRAIDARQWHWHRHDGSPSRTERQKILRERALEDAGRSTRRPAPRRTVARDDR